MTRGKPTTSKKDTVGLESEENNSLKDGENGGGDEDNIDTDSDILSSTSSSISPAVDRPKRRQPRKKPKTVPKTIDSDSTDEKSSPAIPSLNSDYLKMITGENSRSKWNSNSSTTSNFNPNAIANAKPSSILDTEKKKNQKSTKSSNIGNSNEIPNNTLATILGTLGNTGKNTVAKPKKEKAPKVPTTPINLDLKFEDLGGLDDQIALIKEEIIFCHQNADALKTFEVEHTVGGILLQGPPGTGKSVCAYTIAAELVRHTGKNYSLYTHNAAACLSKWIGESERAIRDIFEAAAAHKPSIIFFDEFDAICPKRDGDRSTQEHRTLVATILSEFNKIKENEILVIATTNLVGNIDSAMIREGRFDFIISFPMPDENQRRNIVEIKLHGFEIDQDVLDYIGRETVGFSGSALTLLCTRAKRNAFKRLLQQNKLRSSWKEKHVQNFKKSLDISDFEEVLNSTRFQRAVVGRKSRNNNNQNNNSSNSSSTVINLSRVVNLLTEKLQPYLFESKNNNNKNTKNKNNKKSKIVDDDDDEEEEDEEMEEEEEDQKQSLDNLEKIETNCFLVSAPSDSLRILNEEILPQVLQKLNQPFFLINPDILENNTDIITTTTSSNVEVNPVKTFKRIVREAENDGNPGILLIKNIQSLPLSAQQIVENLESTAQHQIFVLATSSMELEEMDNSDTEKLLYSELFCPYGVEKGWTLSNPNEEEILDVFDNVILPKIQHKKGKKVNNKVVQSLRSQFQQLATDTSFGQLNRIQTEMRLLIKVTQPEHVLKELDKFLNNDRFGDSK